MHKLIEQVLASSVWGASVAALVLDWNLQGFVVIVQFIVALAGAIYFIGVKIPHDFKNNKLNRKRTSLQNEVLQHEIEDYEEEELNSKDNENKH
jgi:ABC-type cobalamin transport system permease subunit